MVCAARGVFICAALESGAAPDALLVVDGASAKPCVGAAGGGGGATPGGAGAVDVGGVWCGGYWGDTPGGAAGGTAVGMS